MEPNNTWPIGISAELRAVTSAMVLPSCSFGVFNWVKVMQEWLEAQTGLQRLQSYRNNDEVSRMESFWLQVQSGWNLQSCQHRCILR